MHCVRLDVVVAVVRMESKGYARATSTSNINISLGSSRAYKLCIRKDFKSLFNEIYGFKFFVENCDCSRCEFQ